MTKCKECGTFYVDCDMCRTLVRSGDWINLNANMSDDEYTQVGDFLLCSSCWGELERTVLDKYATTTEWVGYGKDASACPGSCTYRRVKWENESETFMCWAQMHTGCPIELNRLTNGVTGVFCDG